jgi:tRNA A-37 threonylcarbamoyl transferase component Bud32
VWRAELNGTPAVIKQIDSGPDPDARFRREVTALRLAARADPPVVPAILGTDPGRRILVLEHIASTPRRDDWIVGYATALARLHAATTDHDRESLPPWSPPTAADLEAFLRLARRLGAEVTPAARRELQAVLHRLGRPTGHALLHGDPCPDNTIPTSTGTRFVDLEQATFGDGLTELAYLRIGFPTCWCVTAPPPHLLDQAEHAYRTTWRTATGTAPRGDLTDACIGWLLRGDALVERARRNGPDHLATVTHHDWRWGTATARQRLLHRLATVRDTTASRADLASTHALAAAAHTRMLHRWPALRPVPARHP